MKAATPSYKPIRTYSFRCLNSGMHVFLVLFFLPFFPSLKRRELVFSPGETSGAEIGRRSSGRPPKTACRPSSAAEARAPGLWGSVGVWGSAASVSGCNGPYGPIAPQRRGFSITPELATGPCGPPHPQKNKSSLASGSGPLWPIGLRLRKKPL